MSQSNSHLCNHKSCLLLGESSDFDEVPKKLASLDEFHEEEDAILILENVIHTHNEGMTNVIENVLLELKRIHLLVLNNDILSNTLHGINLAGLAMFDLKDFSKGTFTHDPEKQEIVERGILGLFLFEDEFGYILCNALFYLIFLFVIWLLFFFVFCQVLGGQVLLVAKLLALVEVEVATVVRLVALLLRDEVILGVAEFVWGKAVETPLHILLCGGISPQILFINIENGQILLLNLVILTL